MLSRHIARAGLLLFMLATTGWAQNTGTVIGTITNQDGGVAIGGVAVRVLESSRVAITRGDGTFRLQLPAGQHEIQASLIGYATASASVTVIAGQTVMQN